VGQPFLSLPNLGDVGAHAPEAFEPARGIDDRVAGDRNPAHPVGSLELHFQVREGLLVEELPAKLGIASEKRRE
jgi:hypothetical protein